MNAKQRRTTRRQTPVYALIGQEVKTSTGVHGKVVGYHPTLQNHVILKLRNNRKIRADWRSLSLPAA